jgi:hypothetical protein
MNPAIPPVCLIADVCRILQLSRRTLQRLRRHGAFPIAELPSLDKHPRWSGAAVQKFIDGQRAGKPQPWRQRTPPARPRRAPGRSQPAREPRDLALRVGR